MKSLTTLSKENCAFLAILTGYIISRTQRRSFFLSFIFWTFLQSIWFLLLLSFFVINYYHLSELHVFYFSFSLLMFKNYTLTSFLSWCKYYLFIHRHALLLYDWEIARQNVSRYFCNVIYIIVLVLVINYHKLTCILQMWK